MAASWESAGRPPLAWRRKRCGSSSAVASIMRLIRRRRRRVAHPQVRASGAHPGLQVLWFVPHWGISVAVALHVEGTSAVGPNPQVRASGVHPGLQAPCSSFMLRYQRRGSFFVRECQSGNESYRAGKAITNTAPPSGALNAVTVPSKLSTISFTMAKPRPAPPLLRAREASLR